MAESVEEFFTDEKLTATNLRETAALIHPFLMGSTAADVTAESLKILIQAPGAPDISEVVEECIVGAAEQLRELQEDLVKLLCKLRSQQHKDDGHRLTLEKSLVYSLGERWLRYGDPDPSSPWRDQERLEWRNLNRFAALLYGAGFQSLSNFGEQTLRFTLRRSEWRVNWEGLENTSSDTIALQGHAIAAAYWVIICGEKLYNQCDGTKTAWATWMADMDWVADQSELDDESRVLCRQAFVDMRRIQQ